MKKKILAMLIIMALLACLLSATAMAAPGRYHKPWNGGPPKSPEAEMQMPPESPMPEEAVTSDPYAPAPCTDPYVPYEETVDSNVPVEEAADPYVSFEAAGVVENPEPVPASSDSYPPASVTEEPDPELPEQTEEERVAAAALAELIEPDGPIEEIVTPVQPEEAAPAAADISLQDTVTVEADETVYAYEGMTVFNNGGTVYSNLALVYNNGGMVYSNGGTVYNNGGIVYANGGEVYANAGTIYSNDAAVSSFGGNVQECSVYGYHELRLADYYEPYVTIEGLTVQPGSEGTVITEDASCVITARPGFLLVDAYTDAGQLTWEEDGSLVLSDVNMDTTLTLVLQAESPYFNLVSGRYTEPQTVEIIAPEGCEVWYTTDGAMPDIENAVYYDGPFTVEEDSMLIAVAAANGVEPSEPVAVSLRFPSAK